MPTLEELLRRRTYARERPTYPDPVEPALPLSERWSAVLRLLGQGGGGLGETLGGALGGGAGALGTLASTVGGPPSSTGAASATARYLGPGVDATGSTYNFDQWTERYPNARIPLEAMTRIDQPGGAPDIFARPDLAANFLALRKAARLAGEPLVAREGYRNWAAQAAADARHGPGLAASPGHSWHGGGLAIDLSDYDYDWVAKNAGRFGLYQPMSWEPWHWQLRTAESGGYSEGEDAPTYYSNPARRRIRTERTRRRRPYVPYAHTREQQR